MLVVYNKVSDTEGLVTAVYSDAQGFNFEGGIEIEGSIPTPLYNNLTPVLKVNLTDNSLYYDYVEPVIPENPITEIKKENKELKARMSDVEMTLTEILLSF